MYSHFNTFKHELNMYKHFNIFIHGQDLSHMYLKSGGHHKHAYTFDIKCLCN